ncbi:MAG: nuclear transport factor 2 family protein [Hyphomicrobiales bacterium]|nr:MAG: nuclear transport factor 2 family protein [Hyphomicrobiales bacterium]
MVRKGRVVDTLFDHLGTGDVRAARELLSPDAQVWHCFDRVAHDRQSACRGFEAFIATFPERRFTDVRSHAIDDRFVRQHVMTVLTAGGERLSWDVCVVGIIEGGLIIRLDEYLDRASSFVC